MKIKLIAIISLIIIAGIIFSFVRSERRIERVQVAPNVETTSSATSSITTSTTTSTATLATTSTSTTTIATTTEVHIEPTAEGYIVQRTEAEQPAIQQEIVYEQVDASYPIAMTESEKDIMLRIAMCEAGGADDYCTKSVMRVILNRVNDNNFPSSIYDVINQSGQFTPVSNGWIYSVQPNDGCYQALEAVLNGWNETYGALYFESTGYGWHSQNLQYLYSTGGMNFYK